ncbi:MAG: caspase family protein [Saprospirales bacterium]|nr:caspase family protein [Saprospirales bacterium]
MKLCKSLFISGLMLFSTCDFGRANSRFPTPQKRALIIAIGQYGPRTGWDDIHSENDLPLVREAARHLGIPDDHVQVLQDKAATFQQIVAALEALKAGAQPGDFIYFHFSGHGQQKQDTDGDEADGFDEALVPYDSPLHFSATYQGERLLTDDYLREWIQALRPVLGPEGGVFLTLDACHSGTATRGQGFHRGATIPMAAEGYWRYIRTETAPQIEQTWETTSEKLDTWAPCIVFSASQGNQLNWEYTPPGSDQTCGPLSYALNQGLREAGTPRTFRALFEQIQQVMQAIAPYQQPAAEGDLDIPLFED